MSANYKKLGDYITQRREKNTAINLPICGVCREGLIPPKQQDADISLYNVFYKNDFIFNPARMELNSITLNTEYDKAICSSLYEIFYINDISKLLPEFLFVQLKTDNFVRFCEFQGQGSVREYCRFANISEYPVIVPDIKEQEKIVNTYNAITKRIQLKQKINENLEKQIRIIYKKFKEAYSSKKYKLVELCSKIGSGATPRGGKTSYAEHGISFIRSLNVFDYNFEYEELAHINEDQAKELDNVTLQDNDILFNITGVSVARCCLLPKGLLPARVNQHVMIIRPKDSNLSLFLMSALCDRDNKQLLLGISQSGSTREAINKQEMENFSIAIPNEEIIEKFNKLCKPMCNEREIICKEIAKLQELKQLVIYRISGM